MSKILITGGCGYIGSHFVNYCLDNNIFKKKDLIVVDNLENGKKENIPKNLNFYECDLKDKKELEKVFKENKIDTVFHFAALIQVNESVKNPEKYFLNNTFGTLNLVDLMSKYNVKNLIFSSTAAVYGDPIYTPVDENHSINPKSPYGSSKFNAEEIIKQYSIWKGLKSIILRYFNVIGNYYSLPSSKEGLPFALINAFKENKTLKIFGKNYNTKDGTAIRDYIDVLDLIEAHLKAYELLGKEEIVFEVINLGTNKGYTILEIVNSFNEILKERGLKTIKYEITKKREGDIEKMVASNKKAKKLLNWQPKKELKESLKSLIDFVLKNG